jgi:hypothetical protein
VPHLSFKQAKSSESEGLQAQGTCDVMSWLAAMCIQNLLILRCGVAAGSTYTRTLTCAGLMRKRLPGVSALLLEE